MCMLRGMLYVLVNKAGGRVEYWTSNSSVHNTYAVIFVAASWLLLPRMHIVFEALYYMLV